MIKKYRILAVASAIGLSAATVLSGQSVVAQTSKTLLGSAIAPMSVSFVPPADDGAPTHSRGGATRDPECDALQVLPENGSGLTIKGRPMVQAYFQSGVEQVWMKVKANDGSEVYTYGEEEYFVLPEGKGFAEVPLPDSLVELTLNKGYSWEMILLCNDPFGPNSTRISGGVKRVEPVVPVIDSESVSLQEKMRVYAEFGLWYDYIGALTLMKQNSPDDMQLAQNWEAALRAVNLDVIFDEFEVAE